MPIWIGILILIVALVMIIFGWSVARYSGVTSHAAQRRPAGVGRRSGGGGA